MRGVGESKGYPDPRLAQVATKAAQSDLTALETVVNGKAPYDSAAIGTPGLVSMAEDPGDTSKDAIVLLADAVTAITELRTKLNALMQAMRDAGQLG